MSSPNPAIRALLPAVPGCLIFEDEHLLVVNKPAGINTHAPSPFAGEGIYDWLKHREPRWDRLAIIHRLDKETSGVMVFGKTPLANRALTAQFTTRAVRKKYLLLTDRHPQRAEFSVQCKIARAGDRYARAPHGEPAETLFRCSPLKSPHANLSFMEAEPLTGRTHQIRVHAAESGFPILGDTLYGGSPFGRVCLHAAELTFEHPATRQPLTFSAPVDFNADARLQLRSTLVNLDQTDAFRLVHGASDGWPGWYVDRLGEFLLSQSEHELDEPRRERLEELARSVQPGSVARGIYHKILNRQVRRANIDATSPRLVFGTAAPERFSVRENGLRFELSFNEGYSVGLFLDQRDNRRRLLTGHVAAGFSVPGIECRVSGESRLDSGSSEAPEHASIVNPKSEILNVFSYTCGFSVCAAKAGARVTSLDLSKKYLEWGRRNFVLNGLDPAEHDFIFGDAFDWMRRLARKKRAFDVVILDPPTFSQSKEHGVFQVQRDYAKLVSTALPLLKPRGVLLASTNAADWAAEEFLQSIESAVRSAGRNIAQQHYSPQPPDFPVSRSEPAYLKTVWMRIAA